MAKWFVTVPFFASVSLEIEADTEDSAKDKALESAYPRPCHQCAKEIEIGELNDGIEILAEKIEG